MILNDHETLRRQFAALDDARGKDALSAVWNGLGRMLDVHAACEEEVFYPALLRHGDDAVDETDDAIDDHNKIRDAVRRAADQSVGSREWWDAVGDARTENSKHIAEEEREALPDFRKNAADELREQLAVAWLNWRYEHDTGRGVSIADKDPQAFIDDHS
ncbi:MAG TPA: hemerythrin domain-containing protein [Frankiaceae bacterium]|nr:hemerythrin domain-containing protein [Frankiaceae bacterium]